MSAPVRINKQIPVCVCSVVTMVKYQRDLQTSALYCPLMCLENLLVLQSSVVFTFDPMRLSSTCYLLWYFFPEQSEIEFCRGKVLFSITKFLSDERKQRPSLCPKLPPYTLNFERTNLHWCPKPQWTMECSHSIPQCTATKSVQQLENTHNALQE